MTVFDFSIRKLMGMALLGAALAVAAPAVPVEAAGGSSSTPAKKVDPAETYQEGIEALEAGEYRKAERKFKAVLRITPDDPNTNYAMGLALMGRERPKRARRYFATAVEERPDFIEARFKLGEALILTDDPDGAGEQVTALEGMLAACADPCPPEKERKLQKAIDALRGMIDEMRAGEEDYGFVLPKPDAGDLRYADAVKLINKSDFAAAVSALHEAALATGPHPDILNYLGYAHRKMGRYAEARRYYTQALVLDPDHKGATEYLGELYLELGDQDGAKRQLAKLDRLCTFGCPEREDLARMIAAVTTESATGSAQ